METAGNNEQHSHRLPPMDCRRDAVKLLSDLHEIIQEELEWMSETGVPPSVFPHKHTELSFPVPALVQGDSSVLLLMLFQTQKCPRGTQ